MGRADLTAAAGFYEPEAGVKLVPNDAVGACYERNVTALLLDRAALGDAFFDLRTGVAGEWAQKLVNYGLRMAVVVPNLDAQSERFREFARESNAGRQLRFFATREDAVAWLAAG